MLSKSVSMESSSIATKELTVLTLSRTESCAMVKHTLYRFRDCAMSLTGQGVL
jgi:hypothetical protein